MIRAWTEPREQSPVVIVVAGNIGVGKTTLTRILAQALRCPSLEEPSEQNPYLSAFYEDMYTWAFHSQLYFLARRAQIYRTLLSHKSQIVILDRSMYEDAEIFARNLHELGYISHRDYQTYREIYDILCDVLPPPDLVIYLRASVTTLQQRIAERGREEELTLPAPYLARLNGLYEDWVARFDLCTLLPINVEGVDFEHDPTDRGVVMRRVLHALSVIARQHSLNWSRFAIVVV